MRRSLGPPDKISAHTTFVCHTTRYAQDWRVHHDGRSPPYLFYTKIVCSILSGAATCVQSRHSRSFVRTAPNNNAGRLGDTRNNPASRTGTHARYPLNDLASCNHTDQPILGSRPGVPLPIRKQEAGLTRAQEIKQKTTSPRRGSNSQPSDRPRKLRV